MSPAAPGGRSLAGLLSASATAHSARTAVRVPGGESLSYAQLYERVLAMATRLQRFGLVVGDRVGVVGDGSLESLIAVLATLEAGAAYVPVDGAGPRSRVEGIFRRTGVRVVVDSAGALRDGPGPSAPDPDVAYVLSTSGSTGTPKGVVHTHASALAFVDWCLDTFATSPDDRLASVAPLHFDLSIHDVFVALASGATLVWFDARQRANPRMLAELAASEGVTVWYSTPTLLKWMVRLGRLERRSCPDWRLLLFAGEIFPARDLAALRERLPGPSYWNLYGPTECNVVTAHELVEPTDPLGEPPAMGGAASSANLRVSDAGELLVAGPSVMRGYWDDDASTGASLSCDQSGVTWLHTGDRVQRGADGILTFAGRMDRMVKRHGHRIEPGEIEAVLRSHPAVEDAAVVALQQSEGPRLVAFVAGAGLPASSALKQHCADHLPASMLPDEVRTRVTLPVGSTGKVDYAALGSETPRRG